MRSEFVWCALLLAGCEWSAPLEEGEVPGAIEGTLLIDVDGVWADAFVALYPAHSPPPPAGLGAPVALSSVPADLLTDDDGHGIGGRFRFSTVPAGDYILTGLLDADADFHPGLTSNAGATCGDGVGGHVLDLGGDTFATVSVEAGELVTDRTVVIAATLPIERPAFYLLDDGVSPTTGDSAFSLQATGIASSLIYLQSPGTAPCDVAFYAQANDADGDGVVDPHPEGALAALGAVDVWPRVVVSYLGDGPTPLADGEGYMGLATVNTSFLATTGLGEAVPLTTLDVTFPSTILHTLPDGSIEAVDRPPSGGWQVEVIQSSGQSWVVPNETASEPATDAAFDPSLQGGFLSVL